MLILRSLIEIACASGLKVARTGRNDRRVSIHPWLEGRGRRSWRRGDLGQPLARLAPQPRQGGPDPDDRRPRALGAHPRRLDRDGRGDGSGAGRRRLPDLSASTSTSGRRSPHVEEVKARSRRLGREALYINMNAADDEKRADALAHARASASTGRAGRGPPPVRPGRDALARVRLARPVHRRRPEGAPSTARRWR